jgi:hypothetical protein
LTREAKRNWTEFEHYSAWRDLPGQRHGKLFIGKQCKKRTDDLLKLSRHLLRMTVANFMGHAPVRGHLYIMGCSMGFQPADSAGRRPKQYNISFAAARCRLISATMFLGT